MMITNSLYCSICALDLYRRYLGNREHFHTKCSTCGNNDYAKLQLCKFCQHLRLQHFFQCDKPSLLRSHQSLRMTLTFDPDDPCVIDRAILKAVAAHVDRLIVDRDTKKNGSKVLTISIAIEFRQVDNDNDRAIDIYARLPPSAESNYISDLESIFLLKIAHKPSGEKIQIYGMESLPRLITPSSFYTFAEMSWRGYRFGSYRTYDEPGIISQAISPFVSWEAVREWLSTCRSEHGACRERQGISCPQDMLLIDVKRRRLVNKKSKRQFVALSYVWGPTSNKTYVVTTRNSAEKLRQDQSLLTLHVPPVINDAMHVCERLGERYLWADRLCIIQDDADIKHRQIASMDSIYSLATLVIVAACTESMDDQLSGVEVERVATDPQETVGDLVLYTGLPSFEDSVSYTAWNKRAWTYQEVICARRKLYFTPTQVFYECNESSISEDGRMYKALPDARGQFRLEPLIDKKKSGAVSSEVDQRLHFLISDYDRHLYNYSCRSLTYGSDIYNAFSGITSALYGSDSECIQGLPLRHFDYALLWVPCSKDNLAQKRVSDALTTSSWSWGYVTGTIGHLWNDSEQFHKYPRFFGSLSIWSSIDWTSVPPQAHLIDSSGCEVYWADAFPGSKGSARSSSEGGQYTSMTTLNGFDIPVRPAERFLAQAWGAGFFEKPSPYGPLDAINTDEFTKRWPTYADFWRGVVAKKAIKRQNKGTVQGLVPPLGSSLLARTQTASFKLRLHAHDATCGTGAGTFAQGTCLEILDETGRDSIGLLHAPVSMNQNDLATWLKTEGQEHELIALSLGEIDVYNHKRCLGKGAVQRMRYMLSRMGVYSQEAPDLFTITPVVYVMLISRHNGIVRRESIGWVLFPYWAEADRKFSDIFFD